MNVARSLRRIPHWLRMVLLLTIIIVPLHILSSVTGFGDWLRATPAAVAVVRVLATLFFGGLGVLVLWGARRDPELRSTGYRLMALLFLLLASLHAVLLVTGASSPSDLFPE